MSDELIKYLTKNLSLSDEIIDLLAKNSIIQEYKKGTMLLREGDEVDFCYLVLKGCIRSFLIKDGEEKTIEFYTEEQSVLPPDFGKSIPSMLYLECIEDTTAVVNNAGHEAKILAKYPELESVCRLMSEATTDNIQYNYIDYRTASAEERYLKMQSERPDLMQRIPQYLLASYLGIQPESLSRIRKRLNKNS